LKDSTLGRLTASLSLKPPPSPLPSPLAAPRVDAGMSKSSGDSIYDDLVKGVKDADIQALIDARPSNYGRKDSQVGDSYSKDPEQSSDAIFDGPASYNFPTSMSSMHHERPIRRLSMESRRHSRESVRRFSRDSRRPSIDSRASDIAVMTDAESISEVASQRSGQPLSGSPPAEASLFDNIATFFGRPPTQQPTHSQRPSRFGSRSSSFVSRRSADLDREIVLDYDSGDERWGYASNDDASTSSRDSMDARSYSSTFPPSRTDELPLLSRDPLFGDGYYEADDAIEDDLPPPPPGLPSRQAIVLPDEEITVRFVGYEIIAWKNICWWIACFLSAGSLALLGHWFPRVWIKWTAKEVSFLAMKQGFLVVEVGS
jgi:cation-transporting P-type ATPase 13A2